MSSERFDGMSLPFTRGGWTRQIASGSFRNGATYKHVEKVKVLGHGTGGATIEEVRILASWDIDQGGNKTVNQRKGRHGLVLRKGTRELAFAVHEDKIGWRILSYDCSCFKAVQTQQEAEKILEGIRWRKWMKKGEKNI